MAKGDRLAGHTGTANYNNNSVLSQRRNMKGAQTVQLAMNGEEKMSPKPAANTPEKHGPFFLVICFLGIFVSYFIYGLFQEKITKRKFGDEYFRFFLFMILVQCVVNAMFARIMCAIRKNEASLQPHFLFSFLAFTYVGAMVSSNVSLSYVSYPTQVLGKSAKPIPIMILGVLLGGKVYPRIKYIIVVLIVVGVALFFYKDGGSDPSVVQPKLFNLIGFGEALILASLLLDGMTGLIQDSLRSTHSVSAYHMMYAVNAFSAVYLSVSVVASGELWRVTGFIQRHPTVLLNIAIFSISSAIGQNFIFLTVTTFGPLTTSIITTTRKFFTILASVILFGNPLLTRQWVGVAMVFVGLGVDAYYGKASRQQ